MVNLVENLEFEAELATLLSSAQVVNCATSSNGQQVNMGTSVSNGVLFDQVVALEAGSYKLQVTYMSGNSRPFRLVVNGQPQGRQEVESSGAWCFGGGSPAVWEITVTLLEGVNNIRITPIDGTAAPFIDKIKLERSVTVSPTFISLEAEEAELVGTFPTPACATASNNMIVNMGFNTSHQINFRDVNVEVAGTYNVEFHYFSNAVRSMRIITNGTARTVAFEPTGAFCFAGGSPGTQIVELELQAGDNVIQLTPISGDAPIMDKIVISSQDMEEEMLLMMMQKEEQTEKIKTQITDSREFLVYPNPSSVESNINLTLPYVDGEDNIFEINIADMNGRLVHSQTVEVGSENQISIVSPSSRGVYVMYVRNKGIWTSKKIIIN